MGNASRVVGPEVGHVESRLVMMGPAPARAAGHGPRRMGQAPRRPRSAVADGAPGKRFIRGYTRSRSGLCTRQVSPMWRRQTTRQPKSNYPPHGKFAEYDTNYREGQYENRAEAASACGNCKLGPGARNMGAGGSASRRMWLCPIGRVATTVRRGGISVIHNNSRIAKQGDRGLQSGPGR